MEDRRNVGESSCNFGDGADQRNQSLMFMMMMMMMMMFVSLKTWLTFCHLYQALNISACFNSILFSDYTSLAL